MSNPARSLPDQPNLRYLKLQAKRRLQAGEFASLHEAQLAIAREHDLPSWAALRRRIEDHPAAESHALRHVRWIVTRFSEADEAGWVRPGEDELREHFEERFLEAVTPDRLVRALSRRASDLREEVVVSADHPLRTRAQAGGMQLEAAAAAGEPHRLSGFRMYPVGGKVTDPRVAAPSSRTLGDPPAAAADVAAEAFAELGLVGLAAAWGGAGSDGCAIARGWADLERAELLEPRHRFPAYSISKLITATAVLRLIADGLAGLDQPANSALRSVRLADDSVTVRDLLSHVGGVDTPVTVFAREVPELAELTGPVLACSGQRGTHEYSNGGYAALGQLVADLTGQSFAAAASRLVLDPLGMTSSFFPSAWPAAEPDVVTGYLVAEDGTLQPAEALVCTMPGAGGLWSTAGDLVRFGLLWATLLPADLAGEALTPQAARPGAVQTALGWHVNVAADLAGHPGGGTGGASSLVLRRSAGTVHVALTNRRVQAEPVNGRLLRALG